MILDKMNTFCEEQSLTGEATATTNVLDWGTNGFGAAITEMTGKPSTKGSGHHGDMMHPELYLYVHATGAGPTSTLEVVWETCDSETFGAGKKALRKWTLAAKAWPDLNYPIQAEPVPPGCLRYNRLTVKGTNATAVTAFLVNGREDPVGGNKFE